MPATEYIYLERLARAAGYLRERDAVPTENVELEDLQATLQVGELIVSLIIWWLAGTLFYYLCQGFSLVYSFYYAINVGIRYRELPVSAGQDVESALHDLPLYRWFKFDLRRRVHGLQGGDGAPTAAHGR